MDFIKIGDIQLYAKVAVTPEEQSKGLMGVIWPPPIMVFPYRKAGVKKFWMKDTPSPLDILFCKDNKIIAIKKAKPFCLDLIGPSDDADLVVELPSGMADIINASVGKELYIKYSVTTLGKIFKLATDNI